MIYGASSGGVCAFTAAWQRPDLFRRVFTAIGTYVGMRGADMYPTLIRKTEPKPIRIFQQDGAQDTWNPLFDNWYTQNRSMEESLSFAGYDVNHSWGTLGHEGSHAESLFPDVVKWLWRDYPAPIQAGRSGNSMLHSVLVNGQTWQPVAGDYQASRPSCGQPGGGCLFLRRRERRSTGSARTACRTSSPTAPSPITAAAFGPDGRLYAALADGRISSFNAAGKLSAFAAGHPCPRPLCRQRRRCTRRNRARMTTCPAGSGGSRRVGPRRCWTPACATRPVSLLTPDHTLLFAAEGRTHWVYSYVVQPDGRRFRTSSAFTGCTPPKAPTTRGTAAARRTWPRTRRAICTSPPAWASRSATGTGASKAS